MSSILKSSLQAILRPLIRYLIGQGYTYGMLSELLKVIYVQETIGHYQAAGGRGFTDSRLSLMTGIHRKEVKRLKEAFNKQDTPATLRTDVSIAARLVALWASSPDFCTDDGSPRELPMRAKDGIHFEALVKMARADMRPRAILDELERTGAVTINPQNGLLHLNRSAYVPDLPQDKLAFLGMNVADHLQCALDNLLPESPRLERAMYFNELPAEVIQAIRPQLEQMGSELLTRAYHTVSAAKAAHKHEPQSQKRYRLRLGVYYFDEPVQQDQE